MDKRFLSAEYFDSNHKLTRASSFSELSTSKKSFEKCSQVETNGNLVKQYSCERIVDDRLDARHSSFLQLRFDSEQYSNIWKSDQKDKTPTYIPQRNFGWPTGGGTKKDVKQESSFATKTFAVPKKSIVKMKSILAPPKLKFGDRTENEHRENSGNESQSNNTENDNLHQDDVKEELRESVLPLKKRKNLLNDDVFDEISNENRKISDNSSKPAIQKVLGGEKTELLSDSNLQQRLDSLNADERKKKSKTFGCRSFIFIILLSFLVIYSGFMWSGVNISDKLCNPHFQFKDISQELSSQVHGQESAISSLISFLEQHEGKKGFEVLALIGGIGVGKSYSAEIIKKNMERSTKILDLYAPIYRKEELIISSLSICRCNLVRLENLRTDDIPDVVNFINNIQKRTESYCILILALFNTQETDLYLKKTIDMAKSVSLISEQFHGTELQPALISFNHMSENALEKCIRDAAAHANVELSPEEAEYVKRDLLNADSGCKGASAKVQIVGKRFKSSDL